MNVCRDWNRRHKERIVRSARRASESFGTGRLDANGEGPAALMNAIPALHADEPEAAVLRSEDRAALRRALAGLPKLDRQLLLLRYGGELSIAEVATAMKLRPNTALSRIHRALKSLRRLLEDDLRSGGEQDESDASRVVSKPKAHPGG